MRTPMSMLVWPTWRTGALMGRMWPMYTGSRKSMRSRLTVTTLGTRAWRHAATAAASSMYFRMAPPCTLPYTLASSGVISFDIVVADWLIGTGASAGSLGTRPGRAAHDFRAGTRH